MFDSIFDIDINDDGKKDILDDFIIIDMLDEEDYEDNDM